MFLLNYVFANTPAMMVTLDVSRIPGGTASKRERRLAAPI